MALAPFEELAFSEDDLAPVESLLTGLHEVPGSWVNLSPEVEPGEDPPPQSPVVGFFTARGEAVPLVTWAAPEVAGRRPTIGIEHGSGPKALARLAELNLGLAPGWLKISDHPRRGLVVMPAHGTPVADVTWWALAAAHALSTVPLTGHWLARAYRPRSRP